MKQLCILSLVVLLAILVAGCSRNLPTDPALIPVAEKLCAQVNAKPSLVTTRYWFPTFNVDMYTLCEKEDSEDKIGISVEVK